MQPPRKLISVVITTHRRPVTLKRAIESVLGQERIDPLSVELIVVDDNCDGDDYRRETEALMRRYARGDGRVTYVRHHVNSNGAAARNSGIRVATGEYLAFLDDDDIFVPTRLATIVGEMESNPECHGAYSGYAICRDHKIVKLRNGCEFSDGVFELLRQHPFIGTGSNFVCRTDSARALGGFDEDFERHQDIEFFIRFFDNFKVIHVDEALVVKYDTDRANMPEAKRMEAVKEQFLSKFEYVINRYNTNERDEIYRANYHELAVVAALTDSTLSNSASARIAQYGGAGPLDRVINRLRILRVRTPLLSRIYSALSNLYLRLTKPSSLMALQRVVSTTEVQER